MKRLSSLIAILILVMMFVQQGDSTVTYKGTPITSLPDNTSTITLNDKIPMVNNGVTKQAPISAILGLGGAGTVAGTGAQYYQTYWTGAHSLGGVAPGTSGYVWTSNGPSAYPSWQATTGGSGGSMTYPGAGIAYTANGTAWGSSYSAGQGVGNLWQIPTDPGINAIWMWDETDGSVKPVVIGANLAYSHATHTLSAAANPGMTNPMTQVGDLVIGSTGGAPTAYADVAAGQPFVSGGVAAAPKYAGWTLSGTAAQTYTFPTTSKTLMATDYSNAGSTPTWNQDTTGSAVYWKTSGTGKMSVTGPTTGTTRAKTFRDADDTVMEQGGSYAPTGTWNLVGTTFSNAPWTSSANISDTAYNATTWDAVTSIAPSKNAVRDYLESKIPTGADGSYGLVLGNNSASWTPGAASYGFGFVAGVPQVDINNTQYPIMYGVLPGTMTNTYLCTYTSSGTLISCNLPQSTFATDDQFSITGSGMTVGYAYYQGASALVAADATSAATLPSPAICVAVSSTSCRSHGILTTTGLTKGSVYYVPPNTGGAALTTTPPAVSGYQVQRIGVALSTTTLLIMPSLDVGTVQ